jgi:serine/threonine protein kinase
MKIIASRYRLEEEIGAGGEARVFRARDLTLESEVAVRVALRPGSVARARIPAHPYPGWVRLLDSGIDEEQGPFQVFELLSGKTLSALVQQAPLEPASWRSFVRQSLDAVEALHEAGWVHGDLNADNFICTTGSIWKLIELPFCHFDAPEDRSPLFGSIYTLAPEQLGGARPGFLADLYSLGCLYYYAGSGGYPNAVGGAQDIVVDRLRFTAAPLAEKASGLLWTETSFVMSLLERDPQKRPANIAAARCLLDRVSQKIPGDGMSD